MRGCHMDRIECPYGVRGTQGLRGSDHLLGDIDKRPERPVRVEAFYDCGDLSLVEGSFGRAPSQRAADFDRQYGGDDAAIVRQKLQDLAATALRDIALDERTRVDIDERHDK